MEIPVVNDRILKIVYPKRQPNFNKYHYGLLIIIGGSSFYSGAPALAAMAAFKAGVDMVRIVAPKRAADIIASFSPVLAAYPLEGDHLSPKHLPILLSIIESAKVVARGKVAVIIGEGIGRSQETQAVILDCLSSISVPVVIEDDAIHALVKNIEIIKKKNLLITFRKRELQILFGKDISDFSLSDKVKFLEQKAQEHKTTILYKGQLDIIADYHHGVIINETGSLFISSSGSGCVLAGISGALMARQCSVFDSACAAAYINGLAGEIAASNLGESLTALDLLNAIPLVINKKILK